MQVSLPEDVTKNLQDAKSIIDKAVNSVNQNIRSLELILTSMKSF